MYPVAQTVWSCRTAFVILLLSFQKLRTGRCWSEKNSKHLKPHDRTWPCTITHAPYPGGALAASLSRWNVAQSMLQVESHHSLVGAILSNSHTVLRYADSIYLSSLFHSHTLFNWKNVNCEYHFTRLQIDYLKQFEYFVKWVWKMNHFSLLLSMSKFYQDITLVHSSKPSLEKPGGVRNTQVTLGMLGSPTLFGGTNMIFIYTYIYTRDFIHIWNVCIQSIDNSKWKDWELTEPLKIDINWLRGGLVTFKWFTNAAKIHPAGEKPLVLGRKSQPGDECRLRQIPFHTSPHLKVRWTHLKTVWFIHF